ncbi:MAG: 2-alkenal reductase, partial [Bacteroidetes bacterium]
MKGFIRLFLSVALLGTGFLIGTAWNPQPSAPQTEETPHPQNVHQTDDETPPGTAVADPEDGLSDLEKATINLFERSAPSVVFINTSRVQMDFWYRNAVEVPQGSGTGFVWDLDGHIVTNFHVIKDADRAQVTLSNGKTYDASLVGGAPDKDLAVLRIEAPESELTPIPVGSSDHLMVGQSVLAIGNPFGLDQTLTTGIISALGREIKSVSGLPIRGVIQTDAAINPG